MLYTCLLLSMQTAHPLFFGIHLYRRQPATQMPQFIWALKDHHQILPNLTIHQRATFIATLAAKQLTNAVVITEDKFDMPETDPSAYTIAHDFYSPHAASILCGLSRDLRAIGLPVANAECRTIQGMVIQYIRTYAAEVEAGTANAAHYATLFTTYHLTVGAHITEVEQTIDQLAHELAHTPYRQYVTDLAAELTAFLEALFPAAQREQHRTTTVFDYYQQLTPEAQQAFVTTLETFSQTNLFLVDLKAIALLYTYPEKTNAILCMGGMHIETILALLRISGYQHVFSYEANPQLEEFEVLDAKQTNAHTASYVQPLAKHHFDAIASESLFISRSSLL